MSYVPKGCWELRVDDPRYPPMMRDLANPPEVIRGRGDPESLSLPSLSVVGSRRPTPYGKAIARMTGGVAAAGNVCVVSGGAMGCDAEAGRACLAAGGVHVVVSGCGADQVYPSSSADVYERALACGGAVISAERWGAGPRRYAFPKRNALIAALSKCLVVTEAGSRSGTMSTADAALELGRTVYAIPGSIFSPLSAGTNSLIAEGARIIPDKASLELAISLDYGFLLLREQGRPAQEDALMASLVASPARPDELARELGMQVVECLSALTEREANGQAERLPDGRYCASAAYLMGHA